MDNFETFKSELRRFVAADKLEHAVEKLLAATGGGQYGEYHDRVIHQSGQLQHYTRLRMQGTEDYADLARTRNRASLNLLDLIDQLPDSARLEELANQRPVGVSEDTLKRNLFWILVAGKAIVIAFVTFLWSTGSGFGSKEYTATLGMLIPVFAVYIALMVEDATKTRNILQPGDQRVSKRFANISYVFVVLYPLLLLFILNLRGPGSITFEQMNTFVGLTEAGLGTYVGKVIFGLFRGAK